MTRGQWRGRADEKLRLPSFFAGNTVLLSRGNIMGQLAPTFSLKKLPPAAAQGALEYTPTYTGRARHPVSVDFEADGEISSVGFAFEDYTRAHVTSHKLAPSRRLPTPSWAVNTSELRALLVRFMENRAGIRNPGAGSLVERLNEAQRRLLTTIPHKIAVLDHLCREYQDVRSTDPDRARILASQISNLDTGIRLIRMGPGAVGRMIHLYYAVGLDSVGTAAEIGCHPVLVRQTLHRLHRLANKPRKAPKEPKVQRANRQMEMRSRRRKRGLCGSCGAECAPNFTACQYHLDQQRSYRQRTRAVTNAMACSQSA